MKIGALVVVLAVGCDAYSTPSRATLRSLGQTKSVGAAPSGPQNAGSSTLKMEGALRVCASV